MEHAKETSGIAPGDTAFLGALQDATTTLWKELSPEDQEDYVEAAREWSEKTPPKHIQSRYASICIPYQSIPPFLTYIIYRMASSMRERIIEDFQSQLYKTCGIRSLVLTAYEGEDDTLKIGL